MKKPAVFVITGPTAIGKSELINYLADKCSIEVLNADSRQVYKYMQIGTAQPVQEYRKKIKHHLIDFLEPNKTFSAGSFVDYCKKEIPNIISQNKTPVIAGGSFFYIKSLWDGLLKEPKVPKEMKEEVYSLTPEKVRSKLRQLDLVAYQKIHPNNIHRLQRALLVTMATQKPFSTFSPEDGIYCQYNMITLCLEMGKEKLAARIKTRIHKMLEQGWIEEVNKLLAMGYDESSPALNSLGYREIIQFIRQKRSGQTDHNRKNMEAAIETIEKKTKYFVKRQCTWFRNENRLKKIDYTQRIKYIDKIVQGFKI